MTWKNTNLVIKKLLHYQIQKKIALVSRNKDQALNDYKAKKLNFDKKLDLNTKNDKKIEIKEKINGTIKRSSDQELKPTVYNFKTLKVIKSNEEFSKKLVQETNKNKNFEKKIHPETLKNKVEISEINCENIPNFLIEKSVNLNLKIENIIEKSKSFVKESNLLLNSSNYPSEKNAPFSIHFEAQFSSENLLEKNEKKNLNFGNDKNNISLDEIIQTFENLCPQNIDIKFENNDSFENEFDDFQSNLKNNQIKDQNLFCKPEFSENSKNDSPLPDKYDSILLLIKNTQKDINLLTTEKISNFPKNYSDIEKDVEFQTEVFKASKPEPIQKTVPMNNRRADFSLNLFEAVK